MTVKEIIMRWPGKKKDLFKELGWDIEKGTKEEKEFYRINGACNVP